MGRPRYCKVCGAKIVFTMLDEPFCGECYSKSCNTQKPSIDSTDASGCEVCGNYDTTYPDCMNSCPLFDD